MKAITSHLPGGFIGRFSRFSLQILPLRSCSRAVLTASPGPSPRWPSCLAILADLLQHLMRRRSVRTVKRYAGCGAGCRMWR